MREAQARRLPPMRRSSGAARGRRARTRRSGRRRGKGRGSRAVPATATRRANPARSPCRGARARCRAVRPRSTGAPTSPRARNSRGRRRSAPRRGNAPRCSGHGCGGCGRPCRADRCPPSRSDRTPATSRRSLPRSAGVAVRACHRLPIRWARGPPAPCASRRGACRSPPPTCPPGRAGSGLRAPRTMRGSDRRARTAAAGLRDADLGFLAALEDRRHAGEERRRCAQDARHFL